MRIGPPDWVIGFTDLGSQRTGTLENRTTTPIESPLPEQTVTIHVTGNHLMAGLLGQRDEYLRIVEDRFPDTALHVRGNQVTITGEKAEEAGKVVEELVLMLESGQALDGRTVARAMDLVADNERPSEVFNSTILKTGSGKTIRPKSAGQQRYLEAIARNVITFGIGPAGTGKSWLAVAMGLQALQADTVERIILTRPAVEAGERLGFLPGDLMQKVDPYLRPLYDALYDMTDSEGVQRLLEKGTVEVAPLAFMRGRTLNSSFIILDEAQNTSPEQMKMFLTRIGFGSKVVVTGDVSQVDVADGRSGLLGLEPILGDIDGLEFIRLGSQDVVRHSIVQAIVDAYETSDESRSSR
jgi:phosphate starvation-inducible PhoH-like protein